MNQRIKELAEQAGMEYHSEHQYDAFDEQKFAELIVRECADLYDKSADNWFGPTTKDILKQYSIQLKEHFGVLE